MGGRVAWQRIAPHLLKQDARTRDGSGPGMTGRSWGAGSCCRLDRGNADALPIDAYPVPGHREYLVDWQEGGALRLGQVGDGEGGPHYKMAPIVRYEQADADRLAALAAYFAGNAAPSSRATATLWRRFLERPTSPRPSRVPYTYGQSPTR